MANMYQTDNGAEESSRFKRSVVCLNGIDKRVRQHRMSILEPTYPMKVSTNEVSTNEVSTNEVSTNNKNIFHTSHSKPDEVYNRL